jgi:hypothetical protein
MERTVAVSREDLGGEIVWCADDREPLLLLRGVLAIGAAQQGLHDANG